MVSIEELLESIRPLVGARIVGIIVDLKGQYAGLKVELADGTRGDVWILSDPEWNGCGYLHAEVAHD